MQITPESPRGRVLAAVQRLAPRIPRHESLAVADHAQKSRGLRKATPEAAAWLALVAYVRHTFTDYDTLLAEGYERDAARFFVREPINAKLSEWGCRRQVCGADEEPED